MITYFWAVQRYRNGAWTQHAVTPDISLQDPRGSEVSGEEPPEFARTLADRLRPSGRWRIAVWDSMDVGRPPIAVLEGGAG